MTSRSARIRPAATGPQGGVFGAQAMAAKLCHNPIGLVV
jgi:hypothetical protein